MILCYNVHLMNPLNSQRLLAPVLAVGILAGSLSACSPEKEPHPGKGTIAEQPQQPGIGVLLPTTLPTATGCFVLNPYGPRYLDATQEGVAMNAPQIVAKLGDAATSLAIKTATQAGVDDITDLVQGFIYPTKDNIVVNIQPIPCETAPNSEKRFQAKNENWTTLEIRPSDGLSMSLDFLTLVGSHEALHSLTNGMIQYLLQPGNEAKLDRYSSGVDIPLFKELYYINESSVAGLPPQQELEQIVNIANQQNMGSSETLVERSGTVISLFDESNYINEVGGHPYQNPYELSTSMLNVLRNRPLSFIHTLSTFTPRQQEIAKTAVFELTYALAEFEQSRGFNTTVDTTVLAHQIAWRISPAIGSLYSQQNSPLPENASGRVITK